jgi:hypothetical protein
MKTLRIIALAALGCSVLASAGQACPLGHEEEYEQKAAAKVILEYTNDDGSREIGRAHV